MSQLQTATKATSHGSGPVSSTEGPSAISADQDTPDKLSGWSRWRAASESRCGNHLMGIRLQEIVRKLLDLAKQCDDCVIL